MSNIDPICGSVAKSITGTNEFITHDSLSDVITVETSNNENHGDQSFTVNVISQLEDYTQISQTVKLVINILKVPEASQATDSLIEGSQDKES